jgi:hypothetical protein
MLGKGRIQHINELLRTESEKGTGILGLWVNWMPYSHQPILFSDALRALTPRAGRETVAQEMNRLWGARGVAAVVYRRRDIPQHLIGDPSAWLETELSSRVKQEDFGGFLSAVTTGDSTRCYAVLMLADEPFPFDGKSKSEWTCDERSLAIVVQDAEHALPAGLGPLKHFDDLFQIQIGLLQYYLSQRWRATIAHDERKARDIVSRVADEFIAKNGPKRAREFASLDGDNKALATEEARLLRERLWRDLSASDEPDKKVRLSSKNTGLLSWFVPTRGESPEPSAKLFVQCFGLPKCDLNARDSLASALINNLDPGERRRVSTTVEAGTAVHTLVSAVSAMRLSNLFAHGDEYEFRLPTYLLEAICKSELRNLEQVNEAWRH